MKDTNNESNFKCGEIFMTANKSFNYCCTLCDSSFFVSENLISHILDNHKLNHSISTSFQEDSVENPNINLIKTKVDQSKCKQKLVLVQSDENVENCNSNIIRDKLTDTSSNILIKSQDCKINTDTTTKEISNISSKLDENLKNVLCDYWKCKHCNYVGQNLQEKRDHFKKHYKEKVIRLICETCGKGFNTARSFQIHHRIHTGEKPFSCKFCARNFAQLGILQNHERQHTGHRPYKCKYCNKSFFQRGLMTTHELLHILPEKPFKCHVCEKRFLRRHNLSEHMNTHKYNPKKSHPCSHCSKFFKTVASLKIHELFHRTDELKFKCDYCEKKFPRLQHKTNHELKHTLAGKTPFGCEFCEKSYAREASLLKHKKKWHSTGNCPSPRYKCQYCKRVFKKEGAKNNHEKVHESQNGDSKIFGCNLCDKKYGFRSGLQKHKTNKHPESLKKKTP